MRARGLVLAAALAAALAGCASAPRPRPVLTGSDDFALTGRVLVRQGERADVLRLAWQHAGGLDSVQLETSMGQTVAQVSLDQHEARAQLGNGRKLQESDDRELARQLIGVPVPLRRFADWVRARPSADAEQVDHDADARVVGAVESGWQLVYKDYGEAEGGAALPAMIEARQGDMVVRLRVEQWTLGGQPAGGQAGE